MRQGILNAFLCFRAFPGPALARPSLDNIGSISMNTLFARDTDDFFNPDDLTFIKKIAAVGDSYSAGIGPGDGLQGEGDENCRRYDHSYPYLINEDERLVDPPKRKFQFKSCSGAVAENTVESQIPSIDLDQQVILLSAGGNDAELVNILNHEPWAEGWDWTTSTRSCQSQLQASKDIINSDDFAKRLDPVIEAAKKKLSSDLNAGVDDGDSLGWSWSPLNGGKAIASGAAPGHQLVFGDIDGDGLDDYLDLNDETGELKAYLNVGEDKDSDYAWKFNPVGTIASGLGPRKRVRIADIDGDGRDDYIYLKDNGGTTIYRSIWSKSNTGDKYELMPDADAAGINQSTDEIDFIDINGDGKADYQPTWREAGEIAGGVGTSGANIRYGKLLSAGRADYVTIDTKTGAIGAWLNSCGDADKSEKKHRISVVRIMHPNHYSLSGVFQKSVAEDVPKDFCNSNNKKNLRGTVKPADEDEDVKYPSAINGMENLYNDQDCF
ncbi:hypothetical protein FZEAL_2062 [Fusarium zealandicum]|uniref:SGNH hydrolase-type esterase domain-containing protein n=1 Tax=Fusarium zealandicum TaxID=1053134 RepID=A0A8H4URJ3_9HYPO|nr:hypothetical protein FZEAL_2062 [Fusarium zealandicum]